MVRQFETAADRGHYDARPLRPGLLQQQSGEYFAVRGVEMAHGLVQQDEIERLAQTAYESDALLLPEREFPVWRRSRPPPAGVRSARAS